jgi:Amt family ammonium transporter
VFGTIVIATLGTAVILYALKFTMGLRPSEKVEQEGLDIHEHGEESYSGLVGGYSLAEEGSPFSPSMKQQSSIPRPAQD